MGIRDYDGNTVAVSGSAASDFGVTDYGLFEDGSGTTARQAVLTYQGRSLYPKNFPQQRKEFVRNYGGGIMMTIGDSFTGYLRVDYDDFAQKHGLVQDYRGLARSTIAGSSYDDIGYRPFWERLDEAIAQYQAEGGYTVDGTAYTPEDVKLIVFMGGANDWSTVNDKVDRLGKGPHETDKRKLYGALNYIFSTLLKTFTNADIVVILQPMYPGAAVPTDEESAANVGFESLAQAQEMSDVQYSNYLMTRKQMIVREMAERYCLTICDCCFGWHNPINPNDREKYWIKNDGHLNATGNQSVLERLETVVNNLVDSRSG